MMYSETNSRDTAIAINASGNDEMNPRAAKVSPDIVLFATFSAAESMVCLLHENISPDPHALTYGY